MLYPRFSKPLWKRDLSNGGLVIGTNVLANLGFSIVNAEGCIVTSEETASQKQGIMDTPTDQFTISENIYRMLMNTN